MPYALFAGAVCVLFFTGAQLLAPNKQPIHYCMAIGCFGVGYTLLYLWAAATGLIQSLPALAGSDSAAAFLVTPAFYLASLTILHEGKRPVRSYARYFAVPALLAFGVLLYNAFTAPAYQARSGFVPARFADPATTFISLAADLLFTAAVVFDLRAARRLSRTGRVRHRAGFRTQVAFLFCYLAAACFVLASFIFRDDRLYDAAFMLACVIVLAFALSSIAVFYSSQGPTANPYRRRPARPEWDTSSQQLSAQLDDLMKSSAPYRDERLSLRGLAELLGVEPRQLSYHLHTHLCLSFRDYVNEWRLKAVCRALLEDPGRAILGTAFANGFNSKSSFNTLFFERYGMTPRQFKKNADV